MGGAVLVMHGGLSRRDGVTLEDIRRIQRGGLNPERDGLMCDLLWSDPQVSQSVCVSLTFSESYRESLKGASQVA